MKKMFSLILGIVLISLVSGLNVNDVCVSPEEVVPGSEFNINIEIKNNFDVDAENVVVTLNLAELPFAPTTSSEDYEEKIRDGDSENFKFDLIADGSAEAGTYKIPVHVDYELDGEGKTKDFTISVVVNAQPEFVLGSDSLLIAGKKNEVDIEITNKGLARAKFLEIKISGAGFDILSEEEVYIGDLDSDDFDSAKFEIFTKNPGALTIPVTLTYRDATNKVYSESKVLQLRVYSIEEAENLGLIPRDNTLIYVGAVIILVIMWYIYRKIKKRRNRR